MRSAWPLIVLLLLNGSFCFGVSEEKEYEAAWQLCQAGKYPQAAEAYKKYLSRHPRGKFIPEARFTLARIETSGNNAFGHYQFILDNYPAHSLASQASYATAQYLQNVGSAAQARERYLYTYSRYGSTPAGRESLSRLALLALGSDSLSKAEAYVNAYLDQYPRAPGGAALLNVLAGYWQKKGDDARAREYWRRIMDLFPGTPESGSAREYLIAALTHENQDEESLSGTEPDDNSPSQTETNQPQTADQPPAPEEPAPLSFYYLQIGAYNNKAIMDGWAKKVRAEGFDTVVEEVQEGRGTIYKLQAGPYENSSELKKAQQSLKDKFGLKTMVVER
ncbi:MAG: SPOR domain-containing protein [Candidatus Edwardsbacteria bacterium]|nr:SPOR domain-containing protein [Candidatus Edwardsbacteria bacterium]